MGQHSRSDLSQFYEFSMHVEERSNSATITPMCAASVSPWDVAMLEYFLGVPWGLSLPWVAPGQTPTSDEGCSCCDGVC